MAVKPESAYIAGVNKLLPRSTHREKMHNMFRGGTADVWYSGPMNDLWVEYKYLAPVPKKEFSLVLGKNPMLSHLQQQWLNARCDEHRNIAVVVGTPLGALILKNKRWMEPLSFNDFKSKLQVAEWIVEETHNARNTNIIQSSTDHVANLQVNTDLCNAIPASNQP